MIHSASFFATGSEIAASAWVASTGWCLRTSSMTFSSASVSACEVDDVAASTAVGTCLRAGGGGKAACWRVAGAMAGATGTGTAAAGAVLAVLLTVAAAVLGELLGTTLRAIGRGFGSGTFGLVNVCAPDVDNPAASTRLVARAVDRNIAARESRVTAFFRGESLTAVALALFD